MAGERHGHGMLCVNRPLIYENVKSKIKGEDGLLSFLLALHQPNNPFENISISYLSIQSKTGEIRII